MKEFWSMVLLVYVPMLLLLTANIFAARKCRFLGVTGAVFVVLYVLLKSLLLPLHVLTAVIGDIAFLTGVASVFLIVLTRIFKKLKPCYGWWIGFCIIFIPSLIIKINLVSIGKIYISMFDVLGFLITFTLMGGFT